MCNLLYEKQNIPMEVDLLKEYIVLLHDKSASEFVRNQKNLSEYLSHLKDSVIFFVKHLDYYTKDH